MIDYRNKYMMLNLLSQSSISIYDLNDDEKYLPDIDEEDDIEVEDEEICEVILN